MTKRRREKRTQQEPADRKAQPALDWTLDTQHRAQAIAQRIAVALEREIEALGALGVINSEARREVAQVAYRWGAHYLETEFRK